MRSVRFHRFGEPTSVLQLEEIPAPSAGAGQLLVRMSARPINPSDLLTVRGLYGVRPQLPATPGYEGTGVVEAVGPDVRGFRIGERVVPTRTPGTWQELVVANASHVIAVPDGVPDESAAQLLVNPVSAWVMVVEELALGPGEWLLQTAAGSTLGRVILQIAKLRGVRTICAVRRREQVDELKALGADEVVCTADEDLAGRATDITDGRGVAGAIDAVGGQVGADTVSALRPGGTLLVYGVLSGKPTPIDGSALIFRTLSVRGFWLVPWLRQAPADVARRVIGAVLAHMVKGEIAPPVEARYGLAEIAAAVRHAEQPGRRGKVLLVG